MNLIMVVLSLLLPLVASGQDFDPYREGPYEVMRTLLNNSITPELPTAIDIWAPVENGSYPIVYFIDGYGGSMPGESYEIVMERLSSHGVVIALPWKPQQNLSAEQKVPFLQSIIDWCEDNLVDVAIEFGSDVGFSVDFNFSIGLGHSAGAHVICLYLTEGCGKFKALAYLSPVDGADPWGIQDEFCTYPNVTLNYAIPTLVMPAGLDAEPGLLNIACAPDKLSNSRYYDAADPSSHKWMLNGTDWGHIDFMDPLFVAAAGAFHFCAVNDTASLIESNTYRSYVSGQLASFINGLQADDCSPYFQYLQNTTLMPVDVIEEHSYPDLSCPKPSCTWTPPLY